MEKEFLEKYIQFQKEIGQELPEIIDENRDVWVQEETVYYNEKDGVFSVG